MKGETWHDQGLGCRIYGFAKLAGPLGPWGYVLVMGAALKDADHAGAVLVNSHMLASPESFFCKASDRDQQSEIIGVTGRT